MAVWAESDSVVKGVGSALCKGPDVVNFKKCFTLIGFKAVPPASWHLADAGGPNECIVSDLRVADEFGTMRLNSLGLSFE